MKQRDHKALASYLWSNHNGGALTGRLWHRRFFIFGCVLPDYLPFTYLRGFWKSHGMLGHNAPYSQKKVTAMIRRFQARGVRGMRDCFRLGMLMHYLSDLFTYPHTRDFEGSMREHRHYENRLHECFPGYLTGIKTRCFSPVAVESPFEWLSRLREEYERTEHTLECDCRHILCACGTIFSRLLPC